ncbi:MAG: hypothetical protein HDR20_11830 [Lachnospiraceae bacterium]|nr:hypothetical protein [Lachnospiraceae bacterium]
MKLRKEIGSKIWNVLPWLWLAGGFAVMLLYHIGPGRALVDGDMAGEMILADLLNQEGSFLLSDNWYYATEIHVFFMQLVFRPFLLLFPDNWHLVRVLSMAVIYAVNTTGYLFLCKQIGAKDNGIWSAAALMWPVGMWRLFLGLYGGQYLVYDFFTCYILGLLFYLSNRSWKGKEKKDKAKMVLAGAVLLFLALAGGINGVRETMMLFMPAGLGVFSVFILHCYKKGVSTIREIPVKCRQELRTLLWMAAAVVFNVLGYGYNVLVLLKKYEFQSNTTMKLADSLSIGRVLDSISEYFGLFGYGGNVKLFSIRGICCACGILLAVLLFLVVIRLFFLKNHMTLNQEIIFASFICGLFACSLAFGHMEEMNEPRFWLPFMIFGFMVFQIEGDVENFRIPHLRGIAGIVLAGLIMTASVGTVKTQIEFPHQGKTKNLNIALFLKENDYVDGYADFWLANSIIELTDGAVQARPLMYQETFEPMAWSNRIDYVTAMPEGSVFYVADKKSFPGDINECCFYKYGNGTVVFDDDDWLVLSFDHASQMQQAYETALANEEVKNQAARLEESNQ